MAKDKKKKKKDKGDGKARKSRGGADALKALAQNPLVADVVAAALVATSAALKDSRKAQRLATEASDELEALAKKGAEQGKAMWQLALQIGRRALDELTAEPAKATKPKAAAKPKPTVKANPAAKPKPAAKKVSSRKPSTAKTK
jgi:hypothetical protein